MNFTPNNSSVTGIFIMTVWLVVMTAGSVTAANASSLNDGAAALVITSLARAKALGLKPIAKIRGYGDAAHAPIDFPTAPSKAVPIAFKNAGVKASDVQYHEVNEAFAAVVLANAKVRYYPNHCYCVIVL